MRICYPILSLALAASAAQAEMTTKTISVDSQIGPIWYTRLPVSAKRIPPR